jgi:hypothetical protein
MRKRTTEKKTAQAELPKALTLEERKAQNTSRLAYGRMRLERQRDDEREWLQKFAADLAADPIHGLEWSDRAFDSAGKLRALETVISLFDNESSAEQARRVCIAEAMRSARYPRFSTSAAANRMSLAIGAGFAKLAEDLNWLVEAEQERDALALCDADLVAASEVAR